MFEPGERKRMELFANKEFPRFGNTEYYKIGMGFRVSERFLSYYYRRLRFLVPGIEKYQTFTPEVLRRYDGTVNWNLISIYQDLELDTCREFEDKLYFRGLSKNELVDESILDFFSDKLDWMVLSMNKDISVAFAEKHLDKIHIDKLMESNTNASDETKVYLGAIQSLKDKF